uniref:Coiled-coil-helix-coiled-coil-helix domain-containing protein 7 n=1 Tax=Oryctolagus cuniculus TaxID=9986 RepID=A0A5F9CRW8_RABIT
MPLVTRRLRDPDVNPCLLESDASTRCMDENNYDKERCSSYFLKYKNCRRFWVSLAWLALH